MLLVGCSQRPDTGDASAAADENPGEAYYTMGDFASVEKFDSHVHFKHYHTALVEQAQADNFRLLAVNVNSPSSPAVEVQQEIALQLIHDFPGRLYYATTFSIANWNDPD